MGLKPGTATITAKITVDGKEYSASCKVTVVPAGTPIIIQSGGGEHTHKFVWNTIEATEDTDGELRYQCETCGEIQTRVPLTAYNVFNKNTTEKIRKAQTVSLEIRHPGAKRLPRVILLVLPSQPFRDLGQGIHAAQYPGEQEYPENSAEHMMPSVPLLLVRAPETVAFPGRDTESAHSHPET